MILVTGGTGFLGAYIIKQLVEKGHTVRAIRRSPKLPSFIALLLYCVVVSFLLRSEHSLFVALKIYFGSIQRDSATFFPL